MCQSPKPAATQEPASSGVKKITRLGLEASKDTDLPEWYSQVITKGKRSQLGALYCMIVIYSYERPELNSYLIN